MGCGLRIYSGNAFNILLGIPDKNNSTHIASTVVSLVFVGIALTLATTMAEVTIFIAQMEDDNPGIFGENGAFAQGVKHSSN